MDRDRRPAVLDGGIGGWAGPLESGSAPPAPTAPAHFTPRPWPPALLATVDQVAAAAAAAAASARGAVIDARAGERYRGEREPIDPRPGHIPGAVSVPAAETVGEDGRMLAPDLLRERFAAAGAGEGVETIHYCGSGVTACHSLLAREYAGLGAGRLYAGSWSQWSADPSQSAATGATP